MAFDPAWIEVPLLLSDEELESVLSALRAANLGFETEVLASMQRGASYSEPRVFPHVPSSWNPPTKNFLRLRRDQAAAATRALADALELEDPDQVRPFTGDCPSCGAKVESSWTCTSCGLGFHSRFERDDPMVVFVRDNGGFG